MVKTEGEGGAVAVILISSLTVVLYLHDYVPGPDSGKPELPQTSSCGQESEILIRLDMKLTANEGQVCQKLGSRSPYHIPTHRNS